jgi:hypothetical protein
MPAESPETFIPPETFVLKVASAFKGFQKQRDKNSDKEIYLRYFVPTAGEQRDLERVYRRIVKFLEQKKFVIQEEGNGQIKQHMLDGFPKYRIQITTTKYNLLPSLDDFIRTGSIPEPRVENVTLIGETRIEQDAAGKHCVALLSVTENNEEILDECEWGGAIAVNLQVYLLPSPVFPSGPLYKAIKPAFVVLYIVAKNNSKCKNKDMFMSHASKIIEDMKNSDI